MYSATFVEILSQSVHAERLADPERKRMMDGPLGESDTERTSFTETLHRQLARLALGPGSWRATNLPTTSQTTGSR